MGHSLAPCGICRPAMHRVDEFGLFAGALAGVQVAARIHPLPGLLASSWW